MQTELTQEELEKFVRLARVTTNSKNEIPLTYNLVTQIKRYVAREDFYKLKVEVSKIKYLYGGHHKGDPCIYCSIPHDEVDIGNWTGV